MEFMTAYEREQMITEANQKEIQARMEARKQTQADLLEGTKQLAEKREQDLKDLKAKQDAYKEIPPVSEAEELADLRERAKDEDARQELEDLRKRFAKGDAE